MVPETYRTPASSGRVHHEFSVKTTSIILQNCRKYKVSFGAAMAVLGQIAMARVLYRRYLRGEISEEEWEQRKAEPVHSAGPMTLRPFVDREWLESGGLTEVFVCISYFRVKLPFMPTVQSAVKELVNGAPSYRTLMSLDRFLFRCNYIKQQIDFYSRHPLFVDLAEEFLIAHVAVKRRSVSHWHAAQRGETVAHDGSGHPNHGHPVLIAYGWSSMGNVRLYFRCVWNGSLTPYGIYTQADSAFPSEYPIPPTHPLSSRQPLGKRSAKLLLAPELSLSPSAPEQSESEVKSNARSLSKNNSPILRILEAVSRLHARPAEFYLAAGTSRGILGLQIIFDKNVYDVPTTQEWLDEVIAGAEWYLGQESDARGKL